MRREELAQAIERYARENPGAVVIFIEDNADGSVACFAAPNVAGLIDLTKRGAGISTGQSYALRALRAIAEMSKEMKTGKPKSRIILPPGFN